MSKNNKKLIIKTGIAFLISPCQCDKKWSAKKARIKKSDL